jgi:hypothetical protein
MSADRNPRGVRRLVRYSALGIGFGQPERPAVAIGHESKKSVDSSTVRTRKLC